MTVGLFRVLPVTVSVTEPFLTPTDAISVVKVVAFLDEEEFHSTWLGNKSIYRTRMAIKYVPFIHMG